MNSLKIESGSFCVLIKSENNQTSDLIKRDFYHFKSTKTPDFTLLIKLLPFKRKGSVKIDIKKKFAKYSFLN